MSKIPTNVVYLFPSDVDAVSAELYNKAEQIAESVASVHEAIIGEEMEHGGVGILWQRRSYALKVWLGESDTFVAYEGNNTEDSECIEGYCPLSQDLSFLGKWFDSREDDA